MGLGSSSRRMVERSRAARRHCARDRHGIAALEFALIMPVVIALFVPIADVGMAALQYMTAYQSVRTAGAYARYHPPTDITDLAAGSWKTTVLGMLPPGSAVHAKCGDPDSAPIADCSTANLAQPRWFEFSTIVNLDPLIVESLRGAYPVDYSERFQ
jgi:Flp pilus assembly protein TadG